MSCLIYFFLDLSESGELCTMKEVTLFSDDAKSKESAQQLGQVTLFFLVLFHKWFKISCCLSSSQNF
jgi:hypothetical protein